MKYKAWDKTSKVENDYRKALNRFTTAFKKLAGTSSSISEFQERMLKFQQSSEFEKMEIGRAHV